MLFQMQVTCNKDSHGSTLQAPQNSMQFNETSLARLLVINLHESFITWRPMPWNGTWRHATWCMHSELQAILLSKRQMTTNVFFCLQWHIN